MPTAGRCTERARESKYRRITVSENVPRVKCRRVDGDPISATRCERDDAFRSKSCVIVFELHFTLSLSLCVFYNATPIKYASSRIESDERTILSLIAAVELCARPRRIAVILSRAARWKRKKCRKTRISLLPRRRLGATLRDSPGRRLRISFSAISRSKSRRNASRTRALL